MTTNKPNLQIFAVIEREGKADKLVPFIALWNSKKEGSDAMSGNMFSAPIPYLFKGRVVALPPKEVEQASAAGEIEDMPY
jgi:hypothetical protein